MGPILLGYIIVALCVAGSLYFKRRRSARTVKAPQMYFDRNSSEDHYKLAKLNVGTDEKLVVTRMATIDFVMATHPDTARDILKNEDTFPKITALNAITSRLPNRSLLFANGEPWKHERTSMSPAFQYEFLKGMVPPVLKKTEELMDLVPKGKPFDIGPFFYGFTIDVLGIVGFEVDFGRLSGKDNEYFKSYEILMKHLRAILSSKWVYFAEWFPFLPYTRKVEAAYETVVKFTYEILEKNRGKKEEKVSLLDMMLAANPPMTNDRLEGNTFLFFVAGHETTSSALSWLFYLLARHPDVQERVQEELDRVLGGNSIQPHQLKDLVYLDMVLKESLRWGSPLAVLQTRKAESDVYLDKYLIPAGTRVGLAVHAIHHNPEFWPNPEVFDPERFNPNNLSKHHPYAFLPFSLGKRVCLGNNFSLIEQKAFMSTFLQKYSVKPANFNEKVELDRNTIGHTPTQVNIILTERAAAS